MADGSTTNGMMVDGGGDRKEIGGMTASNGSASCEQMLMVVHASKGEGPFLIRCYLVDLVDLRRV